MEFSGISESGVKGHDTVTMLKSSECSCCIFVVLAPGGAGEHDESYSPVDYTPIMYFHKTKSYNIGCNSLRFVDF